jgi:hypothetical protein
VVCLRTIQSHWQHIPSLERLAGNPFRSTSDLPIKAAFHVSPLMQISLTPQQEDALAPIVREALEARRNVLFVATAVPRDGAWHLQVMNVPPTIGPKLRRLLNTEGQR